MKNASSATQEKLIASLIQKDEESRIRRAERIQWVSEHQPTFSWVVGRVEGLTLLQEARSCYVTGFYAATILTACAFLEHALSSALQARGIVAGSVKFSKAIKLASEKTLYAPDLLDRCEALRHVRDALAHMRPVEDAATLSSRYLAENMNPQEILELEAQNALKAMYDIARKLPQKT